MESSSSQELRPLMDITPGDMVCVMGAGGKATLMKRLIREMLDEPFPVIITSTTNLHALGGEDAPPVLLSEKGRTELQSAAHEWSRRGAVVWVEKKLPQNMFCGLEASQVEALHASGFNGVMVVKTDGARKRLIKAPGPGEPVIPEGATHCVLVLGLTAIGQKADKKIVHRMETVRAIAGLDAGEVIGADHLARLASHPESYPSRFPKSAKRILYLSHCTSPKALEDAQAIFEAVPDGIYDYLLTGDSVAGKFYSRRVHK
ncbi:MAG: selenium cofactor biosynthesis protein YqeC [Nitrospinae bacterium]|nr:selenium cofactor biosynthesis protein YqeC [Nitrospinota bacterium]